MLHHRGRTHSVLEQEGEFPRLARENGGARYEVADAPHHDHIDDLDTGFIAGRRSEKNERLQRKIAAELGDDIVHQRMDLYCRKQT